MILSQYLLGRAIGGIVGKTFFDDRIRFTFLEFEQGLQKTKFAPIDMKAVLEKYFACEMCTNQGKRQQKQNENEMVFLYLLDQLKNPMLRKTAEVVMTEKRAGYQENILSALLEDLK